MVSEARIDANRRNAQKSTGPKSTEGKERARFNALKHGATAQTRVLPGEDPAQFDGLVDAFTAGLQPRDPVERILIERMAVFTTRSDRALRLESARAAANVLTAPDRARQARDLQALALGQRLFFDRCGPLAGYPNGKYDPSKRTRTSWSGTPEDPDDPARLVMLLESTAPGCRWLLDRWGELRNRLTEGGHWQSPEKLKAIRLLGRQPLDAADVTEVAEIFVATDRLHAQHDNPFFELRSELAKDDDEDQLKWEQREQRKDALTDELIKMAEESYQEACEETRKQIEEGWDMDDINESDPVFANRERFTTEFWQYDNRIRYRNLKAIRPKDEEAARAMLLAIVDRAMDRLRPLEEANRIKEERLDAFHAEMAAFDDSPEGERLRRHNDACDRGIHRTLGAILKMRKESRQAERSGQRSAFSDQQEGEEDFLRRVAAEYQEDPTKWGVFADNPSGKWEDLQKLVAEQPHLFPTLVSPLPPRAHFHSDPPTGAPNGARLNGAAAGRSADRQNEPNNGSYTDLQNEPNDGGYRSLQNEPNVLNDHLQNQPDDDTYDDLQNEPNGPDGDLQNEPNDGEYGDLQNEPTAAYARNLQNEPKADDAPNLRNEPKADDARNLQNEPTAQLTVRETDDRLSGEAGDQTPPTAHSASPSPVQVPAWEPPARASPAWPERAPTLDPFRSKISLASSVAGTPENRRNRKNRRKHGKKRR
jgi:hypothetical protein